MCKTKATHRICTAQYESNLATWICRYASIGIINYRKQFSATFKQWRNQMTMEPSIFSLRAYNSSWLQSLAQKLKVTFLKQRCSWPYNKWNKCKIVLR